MTQNRKYFGMAPRQIGILAGLAAVACLLFVITGWFALRRTFGFFGGSSENTPVVQSTATLIITPTVISTETATPVPYEMLIPDGWTQYRTALVELWLPSEFENAAPGAVSGVSGSSAFLELGLTGATAKSSAYKMSVTISFEPLTSDSLDSFMDVRLSNIPADINMAERRKVLINSTEAYRLMFEGKYNTISVNDLLFILQDGGTVWYVRYSAEINDFYEMLPIFEQSIQTFRFVR